MTYEQMLDVSLVKWPQCRIWGKQITEEQALEIIRRTDLFFTKGFGGNNHEFNRQASKISRRICYFDNGYDYTDEEDEKKKEEEFKEKWRPVRTSYIQNNWVSCSWVGGPHGWCNPNGTIGYCNNIGKWPGPEEVYDDLVIIAKEFPFLDFYCCIMSDEQDSEEPLETRLSFHVKDGSVEILDPIPLEKTVLVGVEDTFSFFQNFLKGHNPYGGDGENYFTLDQIEKWAKTVYGE